MIRVNRDSETTPRDAAGESDPIVTEAPTESATGEWLAATLIVLAWAAVVLAQAFVR